MKTKNNNIEYLKNVKELLIIIDMVNGFVKAGDLAAPNILKIVPRQIEILNDAINNDETGVVFIRDSHKKNAVEFNTYGIHCLEGTSETEVIDELKDFEKYSLEYLKNSTNLIFAPNIQSDLLKFENLERVKLMGCLAEVCVENGAISLRTYFDQINKNVEVCVYEDAIDTFDAFGHERNEVINNALNKMEANGIKILRKEMK